MKYAVFDDFFTVLGNKQRVKILQYLSKEGDKSVGEISQRLNMEQSAVSHNLRRLLLCHFVSVEQCGKERVYSINHDTVQPLFEMIEDHVSKYCAKGCKHWE
ncbi:MAG TPA: metalloregulator ArsR/SmtB family transcription factor [Candidatus Saccharimonadales bacterium]|nr:metalloregulator ArsR/SmtB family transcription factor [Candidatus Saccharimonadales bacterium]